MVTKLVKGRSGRGSSVGRCALVPRPPCNLPSPPSAPYVEPQEPRWSGGIVLSSCAEGLTRGVVEQLCAGQRFSAQESATHISLAVKPESIYAELHEPVREMFDDRTWNEVLGVSIVHRRIISTVRITSFHALTGLVRSSTSSTENLENSPAFGVQSTRARPRRGIHESQRVGRCPSQVPCPRPEIGFA